MIDDFWAQLFTQLAQKISPPGLNISGQTLFSMKASAMSATPGGAGSSSSTEMHVGSASIVSTNVTQQKMSAQRGNTKLSTLLMTSRSQMTLNKPRKGRLVNGSVAIQERSSTSSCSIGPLTHTNHSAADTTSTNSTTNTQHLRDLFPLKCSVAAQQFSVSLPTVLIRDEDVLADPVLLQLVRDSFFLLKRLITLYTFLSSDSDALNQSSQLVERTLVMKTKLQQLNRWCDLKSKMIKEELINQYCLRMKEQHQLTWTATTALKVMIDLALDSRDHKSSDVEVVSGVITHIKDIVYNESTKSFINRRWTPQASRAGKREASDHYSLESEPEPESDTDTDSHHDSDTESESDVEAEEEADPEADRTSGDAKVSLTALKLMPQLEPSPLIDPQFTLPLQRPGPKTFVVWRSDDLERLSTHHDVGRNHGEMVDLTHAYERMVIAGNR
jgi:hypothetical protein